MPKEPEFEWDSGYEVSGKVLVVYREIQKRLYAENPLTPDEKRDMANRMETCLTNWEWIKMEDV